MPKSPQTPEPNSINPDTITNARHADIVRRVLQHETYESIGRQHQLTRERVRQIAQKYHVRSWKKTPNLSPEERAIAEILQAQPQTSYAKLSQNLTYTAKQLSAIAHRAQIDWIRQPLHQRGIQRWDYQIDQNGCWIWQHVVHCKYGAFAIKKNGQRQTIYAHRFAYEQMVGPIPARHQVRHQCHQKTCINPAHLYLTKTTPQ